MDARRTVLIVDYERRAQRWKDVFASARRGGDVCVHVSCWRELTVVAEPAAAAAATPTVIVRPRPGVDEAPRQLTRVDAVLVRQLVRGLRDDEDYTPALLGLLASGVPMINSAQSLHCCLERPIVYGALARIRARVGHARFPLVPLTFYSHPQAMLFTPEFPIVVKVGNAQAGFGKCRFESHEQLADFRGTLAMHRDFVTAEPFIRGREYDIRVQKVGDHLRAYHRVSANWKGNVGTSQLQEVPVTDAYRLWATECGKLFGGTDILSVDAIHTSDGKDHILEMNDSASGFAAENELEDMAHCRDLVLAKLDLL